MVRENDSYGSSFLAIILIAILHLNMKKVAAVWKSDWDL